MKWLVLKFYIVINIVILETVGQQYPDNKDTKQIGLALDTEVANVTPGGEVTVRCFTVEPVGVDPAIYRLVWREWSDGKASTTILDSTNQEAAKKQNLSLYTTYKYTRRDIVRDLRLVCQCVYNSTYCGSAQVTLRVVNSTSSTDVTKRANSTSTGPGRPPALPLNERQRRAELTIAKVKRHQAWSLGAVVVCAVGLIASVLWGKTSKGPVPWFRPCERIRFLRLVSTGGDSRKPSQDSGIVGARYTMPRITVDEAGHSSSDTTMSSSPGSSTSTSLGEGVGPRSEVVYTELMHVAPSVTFVPRPDACEYVEIVGILKENQI